MLFVKHKDGTFQQITKENIVEMEVKDRVEICFNPGSVNSTSFIVDKAQVYKGTLEPFYKTATLEKFMKNIG